MRALYFTDTYPPQMNGVSVVTALSVRGLIDRGWECGVVAPRYPAPSRGAFDGEDSRAVIAAIPSRAAPFYPELRLALPDWRTVGAAIDSFSPDIVHCETEFVIGWLGARAARRRGIPLVTSYHTDFGRYAAAYGVPFLRRTVSSYIGRFHRRALRTYTPSTVARDDLYRMDVRHVEVWGRGVDTGVFTPERRSDAVRAGVGAAEADVLLLHVGRLAAEKSVDVILEGVRIARERIPDRRILLVIAGEGPRSAELRAAAGGDGDTIFLGHLARETVLPALYASADAFLFASTTETLGLVILEAMASGLPVIAAPAGGVAEHLRDGVNGLAFAPGDATAMATCIARLVREPALARRLTSGALATAAELTWSRELDRLDASYREVIGEH